MWWWIFFILSILLGVFSSTMLLFSLRRINQYEELIISIQQLIEYSSSRLSDIDESGHFKSDDEVGFVFEEIKSIQGILDSVFENNKKENEDENNNG